MNELYIAGAGAYGEVICELAEICGYSVKGFFDDDQSLKGKTVFEKPVLGAIADITPELARNKFFAVAIGNNKSRTQIAEKLLEHGALLPSLIHPHAVVSPSARIGQGVYIHGGAYIWTKASIDDFTYISPNTVIAHHTRVGKACLISTLCAVGASLEIGDYCMLGFGTVVITGVKKIGNNVLTGGGAVVIRDIEDNVVVVGNPARILRSNG